ncbi:hypothetical protein C8D89_106218 [Actinomycetospora cinnamomea]|uniref:Uncharacterized protein n=2 Tax=Actinomycetospora cinnamomea TaxID=663609 RepID=A0A2U1FBL5_9PSEU|nr:hypothetical protein C8D89_106218 [Actinomycetospora cinnamomea]
MRGICLRKTRSDVTDTITTVTVRSMQRVVGLLVLALVLFWIISSPETAAATVTAILAILVGFAAAIVDFFQALV